MESAVLDNFHSSLLSYALKAMQWLQGRFREMTIDARTWISNYIPLCHVDVIIYIYIAFIPMLI